MRSFAIVPVVLYHAGLPWIGGGFIGVDIFFVISGYLITSIIMTDLDRGSFSLVEFYRRRILRIVPMLAVVFLAVMVVGYFILFPFELKSLGETVVAAALFVSNIYFWMTTNYFDSPASSVPLLHTWSLAVEEQFYIFFPVILWAAHRWARRYLLWIIILAIVASLALSIAGTQMARIATFYLLPTRAWELGAGALLAIAGAPRIASAPGREAIAWLGMALILAPLFYLTEASSFPGLNAVPPVLGATLLIGYAEGTSVGRLLQWRPLVYIGLISYALYLWHWPVIVFRTLLNGPNMGPLDTLGVVALSFVLAALSRPLVEQPFRLGLRRFSSARIVAAGAGALLLLSAGGLLFMRSDLAQRPYPADILALAGYADYPETEEYREHFRAGTCFIDDRFPPDAVVDRRTCLQLATDRPNILLLGDSHAAHLSGGLRAAYPQYNFLQATSAGCRPILGSVQDRRCASLMAYIRDELIPSEQVDGIIIAGRWEHTEIEGIVDVATLARAHTDHVMVIGRTAEFGATVPTLLARQRLWGIPDGILSRSADSDIPQFDLRLATALNGLDVAYTAPPDIICPDGVCVETIDGVPLQFDYGHLTLPGSAFVATGLLDGWFD